MAIQVFDKGLNNTCRIHPKASTEQFGLIEMRGNGCFIEIGDINNSTGLSISVGSNCHVSIAHNVWVNGLMVNCDEFARVTIGEWCGFNGKISLIAGEGKTITLNEGCLLADGVEINTSDLHSIFDIDDGRRINYAADVVLGTRVWLGSRVTVLKGVSIGSGSVIGTGSVVTKDIPPHCLAVGVPARVIRQRIAWDQRLLDTMPPEARLSDHA